MNIIIVSVGAKPKTETATLAHDFIKRLPKHVKVEWRFIKHGVGSPEQSKQQEAEYILRAIPSNSKVILLDERGKQLSSPDLARLMFEDAKDTALIIGGAYGVGKAVSDRANVIWSLGKLVFPHQLARVIVAEQLYRAYSIFSGHPYHHE